MTNPSLAYRRAPALRARLMALLAQLRAASIAGEPALVAALVALGLLTQGLNMFHYPAFTFLDDEGIYAEQAWAVLYQHRLAPYTYFYDHAPGGWILLAGWMRLSGGLHTFGTVIDSGRVLMLLLHLAMVPLLYQIARKLGGNVPAAALAAALFSISPLAIFYQRMVLLDSIMLFWALLSLDLLLDGWGRLSHVVLSGVCFGLALLSKETAIFLLPAMLFIVFEQRWRHQGHFAVAAWLLPMFMVVSWYLLYAALKGELLPTGQAAGLFSSGDTIKGGSGSHVSLITALLWQATRSGGGMFNLHNEFWQLVRGDWLPRDRVLVIGGVAATALNLLRGIRDRRALAAGLFGLLPLLYLARGGVVLNYYVLVAIPFFCLNLALVVNLLLARIPPVAGGALALLAAAILVAGYWHAGSLQPLYEQQADQSGREALSWIKLHVAPQSLIITRDDFWTDLRAPGLGGPALPNVHSHWKVALDPAISGGIFHDDWHTVDYLIMTPNLQDDFKSSNDTIALQALAHAHLVKRWQDGPGPSVELWKVDKPDATGSLLLSGSAAYMADRFGESGAFAGSDGTVTSESEAYAMLRAVWTGDRTTFDKTWQWTQAHLVDSDGLLAWAWQDGAVPDPHTASDADTDTALALLMASKRWNDPKLLDAGQGMVQAIWNHEVVTVGGVPYLTAGDWATTGPAIALNPSYFSPYAYHIFQEVDHDHDWLGVVDSSYQVLFSASGDALGSDQAAGLPPDWVGLNPATGDLQPLQLSNGGTTQYGYDAARTYWRIALDLRWTQDGRASKFLNLASFLHGEVQRKGYPSAVYGHDGTIAEANPSLVGDAGALGALQSLDPTAASGLYTTQILGDANRAGDGLSGFYWENPNDLYTQEWGWFATALYNDALPDLWHAGP